mgnify:CR=1 FL=1
MLLLQRSVQPLWVGWQARVPVRPKVLKRRGEQRAKQRVRPQLEPMGPQQVGIFF